MTTADRSPDIESRPDLDALREAQEAVDVLLDRIDYVNGADAREVVTRVKTAMAALASSEPTGDSRQSEGLREALIEEIVGYFKLFDFHEVWTPKGAAALADWLIARHALAAAPSQEEPGS